MASNLMHKLWQYILELNLFKKSSSDELTLPKERLATRLYICLLIAFILITATASAVIVRTFAKTEYTPSHERFSQLVHYYPITLNCPCSKSGISYDTFATTQVNFHQVCSSQFIQQTWIDLLFVQQNSSSLSSDDVRITLSFFWQVIAGFCVISNRTWADVVAGFKASRILSPLALSKEVVQTQAEAALSNQIALAQATLNRNLLSIRRATSGNQFVSALATNFYLHYPSTVSDKSTSPKMSPRMFNNCSCLNIEGCPRSATFTDSYGYLSTVPGMIMDCLIVDGTLASTLECYYNQTCLSLLHQSLPTNIKPLLNTLNKHFLVNSTIQMLLHEMMIDEMTSEIRFDLYYSQCNPTYCSYSYTHRFDVLFIITTIIGVFGSMSFVLRLIAPLIATVILRWKNRGTSNNSMPDVTVPRQNRLSVIFNYLQLLLNHTRQAIVTLNLFEKETSRTPSNIFRERLLTRLFILMITISCIATGCYIFFVEKNQVITIPHPSLSIYQQLYNDHPDTLQCPCSQLSIPYGTFLNVSFILHQVCTSNFVSPMWLNYLASFDPTLVPLWTETTISRDFRVLGAAYFQILATFCALAQNNIKDAQHVFTNTQFINDRVLTPALFYQQTHTLIESFIDTTRNDFVRTFKWINIASTTSYFLTGTNLNFDITVNDDDQINVENPIRASNGILTRTDFSGTGSCSCAWDVGRCYLLPVLYTNGSDLFDFLQIFTAVRLTCAIIVGFKESKIAWWSDVTYLENIQATYAFVIHSQFAPNIRPLNATIPTRFKDVSMAHLLEQMMVETWIRNDTHFDQFYHACAPVSCSYTVVKRRDIMVILLLIISVCGGLKEGLEILVPCIGKLIFLCIDRWKNRKVRRCK